jgi:arylsulfatase A-like enzyme
MRFLCHAILLLTLSLSWTAAKADNRPPNIIFILADDLGIGDVECYGGKRCQIDTPNIDALARNGLRFSDAHVSASHCIPTRMAIMTGRYPWRFGAPQPGGAWGFLGPRFDPASFTLGKMLQGAGYRTGYVGKWHLGTTMTTTDDKVQGETNVDYTKPLKVGPPQYGFDESFILPGSLDMYPYAFARNNQWQGEVTAQKGWSAFNRVGPAEKDFQDHEVLETFYREAESFISGQKQDHPFFLYLALTAPHTPTSPGVNFQGTSTLGIYGDFVMEVDHAVKRVMDALREKGFDQNTLLLFASDHGPAPYAGNILKATPGQIHLLEEKGHYPAGLHRGYKFSVYEGGLHVPLIAHWPGTIRPGSKCDALVGLNDLMATFAEIAGVEMDPENAPDSISFSRLLQKPKAQGTRQNLVMQSVGPFVIRDGNWKLCLCPGSGGIGRYGNQPTADDAWKKAIEQFGTTPTRADFMQAPFVQLFNVANDVHEDHNLAARHPEQVASMVKLLLQQIEAGRSTPGPQLENGNQKINIHQRLPGFVRQQLK